jgi:hypothetical protein
MSLSSSSTTPPPSPYSAAPSLLASSSARRQTAALADALGGDAAASASRDAASTAALRQDAKVDQLVHVRATGRRAAVVRRATGHMWADAIAQHLFGKIAHVVSLARLTEWGAKGLRASVTRADGGAARVDKWVRGAPMLDASSR